MKFNGFDKPLIVFLILCNDRLFCYFDAEFNKCDWVVIEVDAKRVARFPLTADHFACVQGSLGTTKVEIENGGQELSSHLASSRSGSSRDTFNTPTASACLPNKVVVRIDGKAQQGLDAVVE